MKHLWAAGLLALAGAAVWAEQPLPTPETFRIPPGYLEHADLPDSAALIPAPPASGSAAQARDDAASRNGQTLQGSARWDLATADAELFSPHDTEALSCAAGFAIGPDSAPATNRLLTRAMIDLAISTSGAKKKYQRARPFMENAAPNCTQGWVLPIGAQRNRLWLGPDHGGTCPHPRDRTRSAWPRVR